EEVLERARRDRLLGADVDHARRRALGEVGEGIRDADRRDRGRARSVLPEDARAAARRGAVGRSGDGLRVVVSGKVDGARAAVAPVHLDIERARADERRERGPRHEQDPKETLHRGLLVGTTDSGASGALDVGRPWGVPSPRVPGLLRPVSLAERNGYLIATVA